MGVGKEGKEGEGEGKEGEKEGKKERGTKGKYGQGSPSQKGLGDSLCL